MSDPGTPRLRIVQIAPFIGPGSGVAGVAWNLERELRELGARVEQFTLFTARESRPRRRRRPRKTVFPAVALLRRMLWFTTVGTLRARQYLAARPEAVSICHNAVLAGDIYINHGVVSAAMQARGLHLWRMIRNPTHVITTARDRYRYLSGLHRVVVALAPAEVDALRRTYGEVRSRVVVIPNGVDIERYRPPTEIERRAAREALRLTTDDRVALFVGHEFGRKGLKVAIEALVDASTVMLLVVGGDGRGIESASRFARALGVEERVHFAGPRNDVRTFYSASDFFVLPSAYEANALVILEALASGLPVITTAVGYAPELIVHGENGYIVQPDPAELALRCEQLAAADLSSWSRSARATAQERSWRRVAEQYLDLARQVKDERDGRGVDHG